MRMVVFGAGGFVGGWICEELVAQGGFELVPCVRRWSSAVRVARRGVQVRQADLQEPAQVAAVLEGADVVVNASMLPPDREAELVSALFTTSLQAGVTRFVQLSSAAVYGDRTGSISEMMPVTPNDPYSRGKAAMERQLTERASGGRIPVVILRPSIIYGPFSDAWTVRFAGRIRAGRWRGLGRFGTGVCNLIHGQDVARAALAAAIVPLAADVHVLNVNGPEVVTWNEYLERWGDMLGIGRRVVPNPFAFWFMATVAEGLRSVARLQSIKTMFRRSTGSTRAAMKGAQSLAQLYPPADERRLLRRTACYSAEQASRVLGLEPGISLDTGLRQSAEWCRRHGIV